jgi:glycosyltransferase involved in cell wall biosynthesis
MESHHPLVSCICLTHNSLDLLQRSLACFLNQTYDNKELIVAFTDDNQTAADLVNRLCDPLIKPLTFSSNKKLTLGEKRNAAIMHASGSFICNWDDDDWHHAKRIEAHVNSLSNKEFRASLLSRVILYDGLSGDSYISATRWGWEQTLFCEKSLFDNQAWHYQHLDRGEDSPLIYRLKQDNLLVSLPSPHLYIYVYHSQNVFHRGHWEVNLLPWAQRLSTDRAGVVRRILEGNGGDVEALGELEGIRV